DTKIELLFTHRNLDTTVLWSAAFRNVHFGQNLDTRQNGTQQTLGWAVAFQKHAVDPVPNPNPIFKRFDVDIRRPNLDRFGDNQMPQPNDRSAGFIDLFIGRGGDIIGGFGEVDRGIGKFLQNRVGRFAFCLAVMPVDRFDNPFAWRQGNFDVAIQNKPEFFT